MRPRSHHLSGILLVFLASLWLTDPAVAADDPIDPYDVLYDVIVKRTAADGTVYGQDAMTLLLWNESSHLLEESRQQSLSAALDRFNALSEGEIESYGDVKRALLQSHLWALFDWSAARQASPSWMRIQRTIALLLQRLALSAEAIGGLPDTVAATEASGAFPPSHDPDDAWKPFFPAGLLDQAGPWVCLRRTRAGLPAALHSEFHDWRSTFLVLIRVPAGRQATLAYLKRLNGFQPSVVSGPQELQLNPETPQFPLGTQFALIEQPLLISDQGVLTPSPLSSRIQLRAYLDVDAPHIPNFSRQPTQAVAEFVLQPRHLMRGKALLKAVHRDEFHLTTFFSHDPFETNGLSTSQDAHLGLRNCMVCHGSRGILSVNSRAFPAMNQRFPTRFRAGTPQEIAGLTVAQKHRSYSWGLLQGLWRHGAGQTTAD